MTLEAWVNPNALGSSWRTAVFKSQPNNYAYSLYANTGTNVPSGNAVTGGSDHDQRGTSQLALNTWTHLAVTYDGSALRLYANGTQVGSQAAAGAISTSTGAVTIGGNNIWPEWFSGLIDEVRIYNVALTVPEIQQDMAASIGTPDTQPPSAPANLSASGSLSSVSLSWSASTDNVGVARYDVYRSNTPGFTPSPGNRIAQPTGTSYTDTGLQAGTYYYKVQAEDQAGNLSAPSNEASASVTGDTTPPTTPGNLTAGPGPGQVSLSWNASSDNVGVLRYDLYRSTASGFTPGPGNRIAQPSGTSYTDTGLAAGTYYYKVQAEDAAGNLSASSNEANATVSSAPPVGLVAAYSFDQGSGTSLPDLSGNGNNGTISNASWTIGRFGDALSFNGSNSIVNIPDSSSLDVTSGMTLEAWVYPTALATDWRTVALKEQTGNYAYALYGNTGTSRPSANAVTGGTDHDVRGPSQLSLNTWIHVAATYDGSALRLYVNGSQVASQAASGSIATSTGALRIGGNNIWGEFWQGRIDELRVYNRALSTTEIQTDMNRSVAVDTTPPTVAARTPAPGATNVVVSSNATATFSEAMDPTTINTSTFEVLDPSNNPVAATISYDPISAQATLTPSSALIYGTQYTVKLHGGASGARVKDLAGNALASDVTWTFTAEPPPPPILVIGSSSNPFTLYTQELLRAEGLNEFSTLDISLVSPSILGFFDVAVLGNMPLTAAQVTTLSNWVQGGGKLITFRPDAQLAGLLGITPATGTL
ncbi:MAG TPA: LamG-like jellyroll fold domain-containing protein, partial [Umezawaea sp.]|nr:LamG-like jellyroll fold domain-containing protein [Umezawaea sp.]